MLRQARHALVTAEIGPQRWASNEDAGWTSRREKAPKHVVSREAGLFRE
jgi:hypothetical protein